MKKIEIVINGVAYPCCPTMGAMLRFKKETGKEITEIDPGSFTELCTYIWCCVASAAKRDGRAFNYTLMDFADNLSMADMEAWREAFEADDGGSSEEDEQKKSS